MKIRAFIVFSMVLVCLLSAGYAHAGSRGNLLNTYARMQQQAVGKILMCFRNGSPKAEWGKALQSLVSAEMGMVSYGVSYNDSKLYSRLARGLKPSAYPLLGWRIFNSRLEHTGYGFTPPGDDFSGRHIISVINEPGSRGEISFNEQ